MEKYLVTIGALVLVGALHGVTGQSCDAKCQPPDCSCPRFSYPMDRKDIPQIVYFGFDDAVNVVMAGLYDRIFTDNRKNPNGCRVKMTLFVSHQYTEYGRVKKFYEQGNEIAVHSVTHNSIDDEFILRKEAKEQKDNLHKFAGVPVDEIIGWRSPFLKTAGNKQPEILKELGYLYDISLTYSRQSMDIPKPWPFTMENGWPYKCGVEPCPRRAQVPGFWSVPTVSLMDHENKYPCAYVDGCAVRARNEEEAFKYLMENFMSYYNTTRTPFGLNMHAAWFYTRYNLKAMNRFLDELAKMDDVYVVTVKQMLDWMKDPTPLSEIHTLKSWGCPEAHSVTEHKTVVKLRTKPTPIVRPRPRPTTRHAIPQSWKAELFKQARSFSNPRPFNFRWRFTTFTPRRRISPTTSTTKLASTTTTSTTPSTTTTKTTPSTTTTTTTTPSTTTKSTTTTKPTTPSTTTTTTTTTSSTTTTTTPLTTSTPKNIPKSSNELNFGSSAWSWEMDNQIQEIAHSNVPPPIDVPRNSDFLDIINATPPTNGRRRWWQFWRPISTVGPDRCQQGVNCKLPDCFCYGDKIPGNLDVKDTPQMIYLTIDGSVNAALYRRYRQLVFKQRNPNGCVISGTIFASERGSYSRITRRLYKVGAEIAMQGVDEHSFKTADEMENAIIKQSTSLQKKNITVSGWKTPELKGLGDEQFELLQKYGFQYDATLTAKYPKRGAHKPWPFTLDFGYPLECVIPKCPEKKYPGLWEIPSISLLDYKKMFQCNYADGCMFNPPTKKATEEYLWDNFMYNYETNKAPFGIHLRHVWFSHPAYTENIEGLQAFIKRVLSLKDVFILSSDDIIKWMQNPVKLQNITDTVPWNCES